MKEKKNNTEWLFIIGGIAVLASALGTETVIPWYLKVGAAIALIVYGIAQLVAKKKE